MKITYFVLTTILLLTTATLNAQVYTTTNICTGLQYPVAFDFSGEGRIFITQKGNGSTPATTGSATIKVFTVAGVFISNFYDLSDSVNSDFERGLLGITCDPDFVNNHFVYVYYNHFLNGSERIRIARFTEVNNVGTNPQIIFDFDITSFNIPGNHVGGNLHFRPSEPALIYFTIGDIAYQQTNPTLNYANKLNRSFGKVLRISKDPISIGNPNYNVHAVGTIGANIPTDNPYYDDGNPLTGNSDIIWSYAHRNPFDFCFSPVSDTMYVAENGLNAWDEVDVIHKGANYGWANCEGRFMNGSTTVPCNLQNDVLPLEVWGSPLPSLTGILYYSSQVMPEFDNHLLVADNDYGRIYDLTLGNAPAYDTMLTRVPWQDLVGGLTTLKQGAEGCVYAMKGGYTTAGLIYRICPQNLGNLELDNPYFILQQNVPNPFNISTMLSYNMKQNSAVKIVLYDLFGKEVAILVDGNKEAGKHILEINASALNLAVGNYICIMQGYTFSQSVKISVIK